MKLEIEKIIELRRKGYSHYEIALLMATSRHSIRHMIEDYERKTGEKLPKYSCVGRERVKPTSELQAKQAYGRY
jgi:transposase